MKVYFESCQDNSFKVLAESKVFNSLFELFHFFMEENLKYFDKLQFCEKDFLISFHSFDVENYKDIYLLSLSTFGDCQLSKPLPIGFIYFDYNL